MKMIDKTVLARYNAGIEKDRLRTGMGIIEFERTKEILVEKLPKAPAVIYDIGGGYGEYAWWLASLGYEVHLFDISETNIKMSEDLKHEYPNVQLESAEVCDARSIPRKSKSADAVLLMGPLYSITEYEERILAIKESYRLLKDNGVLFTAALTPYGGLLHRITVYRNFDDNKACELDDPNVISMFERALIDGAYINPERKIARGLGSSHLHTAKELKEELLCGGFKTESVHGVMGGAWLAPNLDGLLANSETKEVLLKTVRMLDTHEEINITKIDKDEPVITSIEGNPSEWTKENVTLKVNASDNLSGLAPKAYSFDGGTTWQTENTKEYTENTSNIEIQVRDKAGNISTQIVNITKITKLTGIEITNAPGKVEYIEGQTFDKTGMIVTAIYDNGTREVIEEYTINPERELTQEDTKVIISYTEKGITKTVEQEIAVAIKSITGIEVKTAPRKVNYKIGERLNTEGLVLIVRYDNGAAEEITEGYECTPTTLNIVGTQEITVTYGGQTSTFNVIVIKKGDVNGDNLVDFIDILQINKHRLGKIQLAGTDLEAADVNEDGNIDFMDILQINKYRLGKINSL